MDFEKCNILEGVVKDDKTVLLTYQLTQSINQLSLQTKEGEIDDSEDENLSLKNLNPDLKISTPSSKA